MHTFEILTNINKIQTDGQTEMDIVVLVCVAVACATNRWMNSVGFGGGGHVQDVMRGREERREKAQRWVERKV